MLRLVCGARGLAAMVVTGQRDYAAERRRARQIAMLERIDRSIDPRALTVPEGEDAVIAGVLHERHLLGAPAGGGRQILVEARLEDDVMRGKCSLGAPELEIDRSE